MWVLGFAVFAPFVTLTVAALGSHVLGFAAKLPEMLQNDSFQLPDLGERLYMAGAAFVLLFLPMVPLKQLMPAVAVHQQMQSKYEEIRTDVEA